MPVSLVSEVSRGIGSNSPLHPKHVNPLLDSIVISGKSAFYVTVLESPIAKVMLDSSQLQVISSGDVSKPWLVFLRR